MMMSKMFTNQRTLAAELNKQRQEAREKWEIGPNGSISLH
jgi:hypothetical protein